MATLAVDFSVGCSEWCSWGWMFLNALWFGFFGDTIC